MANGSSGSVVTGLVIGVILAAQVGDWGSDDDDASPSSVRDSSGIDLDIDINEPDGSPSGLQTAGVITSTGRPGQTVALTFSTGPDPRFTPQVLDTLSARGVDATFCVLGENVQDHPALVRRLAAEGHTLCDHSLTHDFGLAGRDEDQIRHEIGTTRDAIRGAVPNAAVPFFRAPGGNFTPRLGDIAAAYDQRPLGWSIDPRDWEEPGAGSIVDIVMEHVQPGSIVLLHDGGGEDRSDTIAALDDLIEQLEAAGYEFVVPAP